MNETNRLIQINDDVLAVAEVGLLKIRDIILCECSLVTNYAAEEEFHLFNFFIVPLSLTKILQHCAI
jgi:hypothetical protein